MTKNPYLYTMELLNKHNIENHNFDNIVLAMGSDARAYEIIRKLNPNNVNQVIAFNYIEREKQLKGQELEHYNSLFTLNYNIKKIDCSISDASTCLKKINFWGSNINSGSKIAIDISCFTKPYFFSIMKLFQKNIGLENIIVFYTEPFTYVFNRGIHHLTYHSSSGPLSTIEIPGFSGDDSRTGESLLIILLGFDGELASFINREEIAPGITIVINGFPGYVPKFKDISMINNDKLLSNIGSEKRIFYSKANNPFETFVVLEEIKKKYPKPFFNIAPLGTKPMALGACLFALFYPKTRIIYPCPTEYKEKTTRKCWNSWYYKLPLQ